MNRAQVEEFSITIGNLLEVQPTWFYDGPRRGYVLVWEKDGRRTECAKPKEINTVIKSTQKPVARKTKRKIIGTTI